MGDTTVQTGTQPNITPQGDPAAQNTQSNRQNANGATPNSQQTDADQPLGPSGIKALKAERERNDQLAAELKSVKDSMKPLERLLHALAPGDEGKGKSEVELLNEKFTRYDADLQSERSERWKAELANEFGLSAKQAKRLQGATREEMAADAAELVEDFKVQAENAEAKNGRPKPDRSQGGGKGAQSGVSGKDQGLAMARKRFGDPNKTT